MISNMVFVKVDSKVSLSKLFKLAIDKGAEIHNLPKKNLRIRLLDFEVDEAGDVYAKLLVFSDGK